MKTSILLALLIVAAGAPATAHHGIQTFDTTTPMTHRGAVVRVDWVNPHVVLALDVRKDAGTVEQWTIAIAPPSAMVRKGIARDSIKTGDVMSAAGYASTTLARTMNATEFTLPDGRTFTTGNENFNPLDRSFPQFVPRSEK